MKFDEVIKLENKDNTDIICRLLGKSLRVIHLEKASNGIILKEKCDGYKYDFLGFYTYKTLYTRDNLGKFLGAKLNLEVEDVFEVEYIDNKNRKVKLGGL